jgi:hypothetical protein
MLLVLSVILIASVVLYMGFQKVKSTNEKILMVATYILLIGLVFKYVMTKEGFQVKMEDEDFINGVETLDAEVEDAMNNTTSTTKKLGTTTTNNLSNGDIDSNDVDSNDVGDSKFNPTLVVNIPDDKEDDGKFKVIVQNPHADPFKPDAELFKSSCKNTEYFNNGSDTKPYVESGVDGARLYTSKDFVPGMAFIPPTEWDVPQPHKTAGDCNMVCNQTMPNTRMLPIAMMDHGTPINALELGADGMIAKREEDAPLTSVGSIMPKFEYREYVDCYKYEQQGSPGVARSTSD